MYELVTKLNDDAVSSLEVLQQEVEFRTDDIRVGKNAPSVMSVYKHSKWYNWNRIQKATFKEAMGSHVDTAVVGWFVTFPRSGFLDVMTYWQDMVSAGTVVAYSLTDNNKIIVSGQEVTLNKGEGIKFSLKEIHEIKPEGFERNWACLMQLL